MRVWVVRLDKLDELHFKILSAMFGEESSARVKFAELAKKIGESEETIRYNVKKLKRLDYISEKDNRYELNLKKVMPAKLKNG